MDTLRDILRDTLETNTESHWTNRGFLETKCPFCDSKKDSKKHMNLRLIEGEPISFKCFRASCSKTGILDSKLARALGISNSKVLRAIDEDLLVFTRQGYKPVNFYSSLGQIGDLPPVTDTKAYNYFHDRTGYDITPEYQRLFRVTSDFKTFYEDNKHKISSNQAQRMSNRSKFKNALYFFNATYTQCNMREIEKDGGKKNFSLVKREKGYTRHREYSFRGSGNKKLHDKGSDTMIIAEGPFDIINTYFHLYNEYDAYFSASLGFSKLKSTIDLFIKWHWNPVIIVISDSDVPLQKYKSILRRIEKRVSAFCVVYNKKAKDFGDINDEWEVSKIWLKKKGG